MKLALLTFQLGKDLALDDLLGICSKYGYKGIECRAQLGHAHGVELETSTEERATIRRKFEDSSVALAGISTSCRFESLEVAERQVNVDLAKAFIDLAVEVGAPRIRVFGNAFPAGADRNEVVENVGECLRQIGEHAEGTGVQCNLEMHGDFYYWKHTLRAVELADHDSIGIVYNCDPRETRWGTLSSFLEPVAPYLRHVHMHNLEDSNYPYPEFFRVMKNLGYGEYCSIEAGASDDAERVIAIYARLFEWMYWNS